MTQHPEHSRWLSEAAETLASEILAAQDAPTHCDLLIIGSGYGAAVAAARFAGARRADDGQPLRIVVLERGEEYLPGQFPASFAEVPGHVRFSREDGRPARGRPSGLFDLRLGQRVSTLLGNGLGGGSLINAAVMERPGDDAFARGWPAGLNRERLAPAYERAESMLGPEQIPEQVPKLDSLLRAGQRLATLEPPRKAHVAVAFRKGPQAASNVEMEACLRCGDCVSGCNHRAKKSLDTNYLALARQRGVRLFCGGTAHCIRARPGGGYAVDFYLTDRRKARSDGPQLLELRTRQLIVAAGALGSTELLLRSRAAGLALSDRLGAGFSCNGDMIAVAHRQKPLARASASEGDAPAARGIGPTITGLLRVQPPGGPLDDPAAPPPRPLAIEEFAIPGPLRRVFAEVVTSTAALHGLARADDTRHRAQAELPDPLAVDDAALEHTAVYGLMGDDGAAGSLSLCAAPAAQLADAQLRIDWPEIGDAPVFKAQMAALRRAHEASDGLGGQVLPNPLWQALPRFAVLDGLAPDLVWPGLTLSVHPLGGCRMADGRDDGVVDACGRVFDGAAAAADATWPGLAVLDGSIVPVSLGINPSLTIAALAEQAVPQLARHWGLVLAEGSMPPHSERPLRRDLRAPQAPAATQVDLLERMSGAVQIADQAFELGAEVRFAGFEVRQLRRLPARLPLAEVLLHFGAGPDAPRARCSGEAEVMVREDSDAIERFVRSAPLTGEKILAFLKGLGGGGEGALPDGALGDLAALASHFGESRLIRYRWRVGEVDAGVPLRVGDELVLTKRIAFERGANPWRQLTEGRLARLDDGTPVELGRLAVDPGFFVDRLQPLLGVQRQQDMPNQLGDLAELGLWLLRVLLTIHLPDFLPPADAPAKALQRLPGSVDGVAPEEVPLPREKGVDPPPRRQLVRYAPPAPQPGLRPVLLIHGFGASGSTFTHPAIGTRNLAGALLDAGREVWVVDLRTSIGFPPRPGDPFQSFDDVAAADIPDALRTVAQATRTRGGDGRVDVVAHCIGAAMFSVAVLRCEDLHRSVGAVVLSQVGLLPRASALNRLRAFVASYLQQYLQVERFDTLLDHLPTGMRWLIDGLLATYPYPDDDGEAERVPTAPPFAAVRHRADAIFGQTMRLANIADALLGALADIYGFVSVPGLAQVGHYARRQVLTDIGGQNRVVAFDRIAERFAFPVMLLHGRHNAVFDWRGALDSYRLLVQVFDGEDPWRPGTGDDAQADIALGMGRPRQLRVLANYGHQDTLIGEHARRDVFVHVLRFLQEQHPAQQPGAHDPEWTARLAWMGPWLGRAGREPGLLHLRIALRPPPAHAAVRGVVLVPATQADGRWRFDTALAVTLKCGLEELQRKAIDLWLKDDALGRFQGFAVLTAHDDLPTFAGKLRVLFDKEVADGLFEQPRIAPAPDLRRAVEATLADAQRAGTEIPVVRLDPAWIAAVQPPGAAAQDRLCLALASCQYGPGLVDARPAEASYRRLAQRLDETGTPRPQLLLLLGDQVYVDDTAGLFDADGSDDPAAAYLQAFRMPALRRVTGALPSCPLLDDHEVVDDWEPEHPPMPAHRAALDAYVAFQHKLVADPAALSPDTPFDYTLAPAGFPVYMLDTRSRRGARSLRPGPQHVERAALCLPAQMQALAQWLERGPAELPRFIASSVTVFPMPRSAVFGAAPERIGLDDWSGYPATQRELLALIRRSRARHVVLLSGDRHMSSVSSLWLTRPDGTPMEVVSIVASGLYAPWPFANARADEFWLDGTLNADDVQRNGFEASMLTAAVGSGNGFAQLLLCRDAAAAAGWRLQVRLDLDDGLRVCERALGDAADRRWHTCAASAESGPDGGPPDRLARHTDG